MSFVIFDESEFGQTDLTQTLLIESDLTKIKNKNMGDTIVRGSVFAYTNLTGLIMPKEMYGTNFNNAEASKTDFSKGNISLTYFGDANLEGANFEYADLSGRFEVIEIKKPKTNLEFENIRNEINKLFPILYDIVKIHDAGERLMVEVIGYNNFSNANLKNVNFDNARMFWAYMTDSDLSNSSFVNADLSRAYLDGAKMHGANLEGANLQDANLEGANLEGANLQDANLEGANLEGANLEGANLNCINHEICK